MTYRNRDNIFFITELERASSSYPKAVLQHILPQSVYNGIVENGCYMKEGELFDVHSFACLCLDFAIILDKEDLDVIHEAIPSDKSRLQINISNYPELYDFDYFCTLIGDSSQNDLDEMLDNLCTGVSTFELLSRSAFRIDEKIEKLEALKVERDSRPSLEEMKSGNESGFGYARRPLVSGSSASARPALTGEIRSDDELVRWLGANDVYKLSPYEFFSLIDKIDKIDKVTLNCVGNVVLSAMALTWSRPFKYGGSYLDEFLQCCFKRGISDETIEEGLRNALSEDGGMSDPQKETIIKFSLERIANFRKREAFANRSFIVRFFDSFKDVSLRLWGLCCRISLSKDVRNKLSRFFKENESISDFGIYTETLVHYGYVKSSLSKLSQSDSFEASDINYLRPLAEILSLSSAVKDVFSKNSLNDFCMHVREGGASLQSMKGCELFFKLAIHGGFEGGLVSELTKEYSYSWQYLSDDMSDLKRKCYLKRKADLSKARHEQEYEARHGQEYEENTYEFGCGFLTPDEYRKYRLKVSTDTQAEDAEHALMLENLALFNSICALNYTEAGFFQKNRALSYSHYSDEGNVENRLTQLKCAKELILSGNGGEIGEKCPLINDADIGMLMKSNRDNMAFRAYALVKGDVLVDMQWEHRGCDAFAALFARISDDERIRILQEPRFYSGDVSALYDGLIKGFSQLDKSERDIGEILSKARFNEQIKKNQSQGRAEEEWEWGYPGIGAGLSHFDLSEFHGSPQFYVINKIQELRERKAPEATVNIVGSIIGAAQSVFHFLLSGSIFQCEAKGQQYVQPCTAAALSQGKNRPASVQASKPERRVTSPVPRYEDSDSDGDYY